MSMVATCQQPGSAQDYEGNKPITSLQTSFLQLEKLANGGGKWQLAGAKQQVAEAGSKWQQSAAIKGHAKSGRWQAVVAGGRAKGQVASGR